MNKKTTASDNVRIFVFIAFLLFAFCVLKVLRGSDTSSNATGGIWNYISLLYYPLTIFALIRTTHTLKAVFVTSLLYIITALITAIFNFNGALDINTVYNFLMIPYFWLVFVSFYCYADHNKLGYNIIVFAFFVCLLLNLMTIIKYQFGGAERHLASDIYYSLGLFPFVLVMTKNKRIKTVAVLGMFFAVFFSNKRTGIIAFIIAYVVFKLVSEKVSNANNFLNALKTVLIIAVILLAFYYAGRYFDNKFALGIFERLERLQDDGGSGRDKIYAAIWQEYKDSGFAEKIFGHGMYATNALTGFNAHNDFLEVLYDYGVFAFIFIICFYLSLIRHCVNMVKQASPYAAAFSASIVIGLFLSMFSFMLVYFTYVTPIVAFWGYSLSMEKHRLIKFETTE